MNIKMKNDETFVGAMAGANLASAGIGQFFQNPENLMRFGVALGQIGVAAMTIYFVWRRAQAIKLPAECPLKRKRKGKVKCEL